MKRGEVVSREEVTKISAISPAHRLTVQEFLKNGRWMMKDVLVGGSENGNASHHP